MKVYVVAGVSNCFSGADFVASSKEKAIELGINYMKRYGVAVDENSFYKHFSIDEFELDRLYD